VSDMYLQKHCTDQSSFCFSVSSLLWIDGVLHINLADELLACAAASFVAWATGKWCCGRAWCQAGLEGWGSSLRHLWFWPICSSSLQQLHKKCGGWLSTLLLYFAPFAVLTWV